jgi:hypothetical protein
LLTQAFTSFASAPDAPFLSNYQTLPSMACKRRAPSPAPLPPQQSSSSEESGSDTKGEEEGSPRAAAVQIPPQNPQPHAPATAAEPSEEEEESDTEVDAQDSQMHLVSSSPAKAAATVPQPKSDADEEEDGDPDELEPEVPQPVQKKAAATNKSKTMEPQDKKRPVLEPTPSGKAKKAKAEVRKVMPEATQAGKGKKAKAVLEKAPVVQAPPGKAKKLGGKLEKLGLDSSPSSKSACAQRIWSKEDVLKILEALAGHVKKVGVLPKTDVILAVVHDRLDRKNCTNIDMYEKIRGLKKRFEKLVSTGVMPSGEDELRIYNLSDATRGEKGKEGIASAGSQNELTVTMGKKFTRHIQKF